MILWKEGPERSDRVVVLKKLGVTGAALLAVGSVILSFVHYYGRVRPDRLLSAGEIELKRMAAGASSESVLLTAEGPGNAAAHYVMALNSYATRRIPYLKNRGFKAFVKEPPVTQQEIRELEHGALRARCDFFEMRNGKPVFTLIKGGKGPWKFRRAEDPSEPRPYYTPLRLLLVGILYQAADLTRAGRHADSAWLYRLVARVGAHILQRPGCLLDFELGLEMQVKAMRGLENSVALGGDTDGRQVALYRRAVEQLGERFRRKYGQLDNPEAAALIAMKDEDPMWRIEAVASLRDQQAYHSLGILERRAINASIAHAEIGRAPKAKSAGRIASAKTATKN